MKLLAILLLVLAAVIGVLALLVGAAMVIDPSLVRPGLLTLALLVSLAGACVAVGRRLREETAEAQDWEGSDPDKDH